MNALATRYLGLELRHPVIASASPLTASFDGVRRLEDAGAAAVVLTTLFEEEIRARDTDYAMFTEYTAGSHPEAATYFPALPDYRHGMAGHLETLRRAAGALDIPVIASLNAISDGGWPDLATELEQAGADALELSLYLLPTDPALNALDVENDYVEIVRRVKAKVRIPVSVKLPPFFTAAGNLIKQLEAAGADGVVLFNRFFFSDVDLSTLAMTQEATLSAPGDIHLPLTWIALLSRNLKLSLAAGTGVDTSNDVVKFLLAGADVVATASALLRRGPTYMTSLVEGLDRWLAQSGFRSVAEMQAGLARRPASRTYMYLRDQYRRTLAEYAGPA